MLTVVGSCRPTWGRLVAVLLLAAPALGETGKVYLVDGTVLRGDIELTRTQAVIRNLAGVVRCPRERVDHVEWLEPAKTIQSEYLRRFFALEPKDVRGHFALAQWLVERTAWSQALEQCNYVLELDPRHAQAATLLERIKRERHPVQEAGVTTRPGQPERAGAGRASGPGLPPPPALSARDILHLKLSELRLDGAPERLLVKFRRVRGERDVVDLVRREMVKLPDYDPDWDRTLARGQPFEKLPVVLRVSGLKYADRIELRSNPAVFSAFRRQVLPLVLKGCTRAGCHGGRTARVFRLPSGPRSTDAFAYTSFVLLDAIKTADGPLIDRASPPDSALLRYMLPAASGRSGHPPVKSGRVGPVLRGTADPRYQNVVEWIAALRSPHPDYELEYRFPVWFEPLTGSPGPAAGQAQSAGPPAPAGKRSGDEKRPPPANGKQQAPSGKHKPGPG